MCSLPLADDAEDECYECGGEHDASADEDLPAWCVGEVGGAAG